MTDPRSRHEQRKARQREWDKFAQQLEAAYEQGRLVPFIGAGLSVPACPGWPTFIQNLEHQAGIAPSSIVKASPDDLIRRAHDAVRRLRYDDSAVFTRQIGSALKTSMTSIPAQTEALARAWWPLVLTTNYDNYYARAFRGHDRYLEVLGRSSMDCEMVLNSLTSASHSLLWALQGFLDGPERRAFPRDVYDHLGRELVVGHAEYRSVTHREPHFRRAFAEVYRSRSMLFLGFGLRDPYVLDLLGEILEIYGPSPHQHYALLKKGELSRSESEFMLERYQTVVYEYNNHNQLPRLLQKLVRKFHHGSCRKTRWSYSLDAPQVPGSGDCATDFDVVRARLPAPDETRAECLAVNGYRQNRRFYFSQSIRRDVLKPAGIDDGKQPSRRSGRVARFADRPVYAATASDGENSNDLRAIHQASMDLFDRAWDDGFRHIHMQLLAAGTRRIYPARMSFIQTTRAFADWRRMHRRRNLRLSVYTPEPAVADQIASGRLDVVELLTCIDIRFWVVVEGPDGVGERRLFQSEPHTAIKEIRERVRVPQSGWKYSVYPRPAPVGGELRRVASPTLQSEGVVPGSTLVFERRRSSR